MGFVVIATSAIIEIGAKGDVTPPANAWVYTHTRENLWQTAQPQTHLKLEATRRDMPSNVVSIQGGREQKQADDRRMNQADVDKYVSEASEGTLICRQSRRHRYPPINRNNIRFEGRSPEGFLIRRVECLDCQLAVQVQQWELIGSGRKRRVRKVASYLTYQEGRNGERYVAPSGLGSMTSAQVGEALMTSAIEGFTLLEINRSISKGDTLVHAQQVG
jgi:hypothetical protein